LPAPVSIITVYHNTPDEVLKLHASVRRFLSPECEFIVADNDAGIDLREKLPGAAYLRLSGNLGFGGANNAAVGRATAPVLFFVNPDCEFVDDCVGALLPVLDSADVVGPRVFNTDGSVQLSFGPALSICGEALQKIRIAFEKSGPVQKWLRRKKDFEPDYVSGCALMMRADLFRRLGGFDENFFLYQEDVDLCKRVTDSGGRVRYVPSARIVHARNLSVSKLPGRMADEYRKSQRYYYRKHHGPLQNGLLGLYLTLRGR
jgi:GT2 family glycosyltransferase